MKPQLDKLIEQIKREIKRSEKLRQETEKPIAKAAIFAEGKPLKSRKTRRPAA